MSDAAELSVKVSADFLAICDAEGVDPAALLSLLAMGFTAQKQGDPGRIEATRVALGACRPARH